MRDEFKLLYSELCRKFDSTMVLNDLRSTLKNTIKDHKKIESLIQEIENASKQVLGIIDTA